MNKFVLIFFTILLSSFSIPSTTYAQNDTAKIDETKNAVTSSIIKYNLAFPGLLPDSPFYKLKIIRDKISLGLISDPEKRINFLLLQTDKGILASAMLTDKKEIKLAKETALKAENNFTILAAELWNLPKKPNKDFFEKLEKEALKHQEVLSSLAKRISKEDAKTFLIVADFSKRNLEAVKKYQSRRIIY